MYLHHFLGWYDIPDLFITPSNFMRNKLIEFGMSPQKLVHIPNFVEPEKFQVSDESEEYFVYVGRLVPIKGLITLLQAMKKVKTSMRLLLLGDGPQRDILEQVSEESGLHNVYFLGQLEFQELIRVVSLAKFNILPSEVYENCPMSVLESMAMGKPVIGSNIGGIPELISDGVDGLLFETGNSDHLAEKINWMIDHPKSCSDMGITARRKIEQFYNPEIHYQAVAEQYSRILN
jgi:glycosyltransferase involved in cell wall biosynthesis